MSNMDGSLAQAQEIIDYHFKKPDLLWEALQVAGSGVSRIDDKHIAKGNEPLAIYGDAVMAPVLCKEWYVQNGTPGGWTQSRQTILSNGNLARIANTTGLVDCIHCNPLNPRAISTRLAANVVEAVVGAVCLDGGLEAAEEVMKTLGCVI